MAFQATFCIITAALISGAHRRAHAVSAYLAFIPLWSVVVYAPLAHWVWGGGWLADMGAWDFAGGTVVHVNAGVAALVAALVVGKRSDYGRPSILPHNVPLVLLGAGLLWFGWFGFNAGSALAASPIAGLAFVTTMLAPAGHAGGVDVPRLRCDRASRRRSAAATAIVVGLVAVTPAAGFISPMSALLLGAIAAVPSYFGLIIRAKTSLDDSLDVVAAHGVGGTVGALLTGVFAEKSLNGVRRALYGNPGQVLIQGTAVLAAIVYSGSVSFVLLKLIGLARPFGAGTGRPRPAPPGAERRPAARPTPRRGGPPRSRCSSPASI